MIEHMPGASSGSYKIRNSRNYTSYPGAGFFHNLTIVKARDYFFDESMHYPPIL